MKRMTNVFKIIASDVKRLSVNVVAYVVIIGLSVIPCLYAWFNILSNWDPYGPDATKNLQVAVASSDAGMVIGGAELNVGDKIISNLKENDSIGWVFTDTAAEAINGVYAGDYYAALIIDESFSRDMVSFLGGEIENPKIIYYENDKKNAIAPKITNKVKNTLKNEIDQAFVSTIAKMLLEASDYLVSVDQNGNLTGEAINKLENLDSDITAVILILDSYIAVMDSTENIMVAGDAVTEQIDSLIESAEAMAESAKTASQATGAVVKTSADIMKQGLGAVSTGAANAQKMAEQLMEAIENGTDDIEQLANSMEPTIKWLYAHWYYQYQVLGVGKDTAKGKNVEDDFRRLLDGDGDPTKEATESDFTYQFKVKAEALTATEKADVNSYVNIATIDLKNTCGGHIADLKEAAATASADTKNVSKTVSDNVSNIQGSINKIISEYNTSVAPSVDKSLDSVSDSLKEIQKILNYKATSIDKVTATLKNYPSTMDSSKESLIKARQEAVDMEEKLSALIEETKGLETNEKYHRIISLLENDPEFLASFISSPVKLSEEYIYEVSNNGSAASPFYIVLSIWVGSLIMSTILKTTVKDTRGMVDLKNWQCFLGRYFITFIIGQIQTIITVLGALLYVGIQCEHPFLFWLACSWISMVFSFLLYSFTYAFGNLGEALSVILMVIQVAGAGGTFPIEVLPKVFQVLYKFMPFNYAMNALRECVAGFYKNTFWIYLLCLVPYVLIAILNGVILYYPCKRLNHQIDISKEKSGILI